ncbi:MAG TPA: glycerate kinase, partial [Clostridiales bacterium]|nr:glycerate kinase [Clostridiales bacterium]
AQSVRGKVCAGVARRAAAAGKRVYAVCGSLGKGAQAMTGLGVRGMFAASEAGRPWEEIVRTCREDLYKAAFAAAREIADKTE